MHEDPEWIRDLHALHAEGGTASQSSGPRAAREEHAVHKRTVRQQAVHGEPRRRCAGRDKQTDRQARTSSSPLTTSTCAKPADSENMTEMEERMIPRQAARRQRLKSRTTRCMIETASEKSGPTVGEKNLEEQCQQQAEKSGPTAGEKSNHCGKERTYSC